MGNTHEGLDWNEVHKRAILVGKRGTCRLSPWMVQAYRYRLFRPIVRYLIERYEGGSMHSTTLRTILKERFGVEVGRYSYGPLLGPGVLPEGTRIGRYCSFAPGISVFRRNHPKGNPSLHPFFYDQRTGVFPHDLIEDNRDNPLIIGSDVWIGNGATILPGCRNIGNGAIVAASAVVTKDVPDFAIVAGNPARIIAYRFDEETRAALSQSGWWSKSLEELSPSIERFTVPLDSQQVGRRSFP